MSTSSRFWADLSTREFAQRQASGLAEQTVAVLPVAAIEQHGPHLPVSVDTDLVNGVVAASLVHLPSSVPVLFPGTLTLSAETTIRLWTEIGESVARAGLRKLVLFNSHGGQVSIMDIVARELRARCNLIVLSTSWYTLPLGEEVDGLFPPAEHRFGIHAGDIETSMMLALHPQRVDMAQARDFRSASQERAAEFPILGNGRSAKLGWQMQDYHPAGAAGNAAAASADKGRALVDAAGLQLAALLQEVARLPLSTLRADPDIAG
jgi:creatinine amidohydrolase